MTGVKNRNAYEETLVKLRNDTARLDKIMVVVIDVDNLTVINNTHGHHSGDEVIKTVANCLLKTIGTKADVYRVGGDEFVCIAECDILGYVLKAAEVPLVQQYRGFTMKFKGNEILLYLPRIDINMDAKQYIAEELGGMIYEMAARKLKPDVILRELNRYIPETRNSSDSAKQLFRKYFYSVVQYKERAPGIYPKFDKHMKQALDMEFFRRMLKEILVK